MADSSIYKEYTFTDSEWHDMKFFGETTRITLKSIGGQPISVYMTTDPGVEITDAYLESIHVDPIEIGGVTYEMSSTSPTERVYAKAPNGTGKIGVRVHGTIDPNEDITTLAAAISDVTIKFTNHINDKDNPHEVNKSQVGLGNIPNAISDAIDKSSSDVLATSKAVYTVQQNLLTHSNDKNNPHETTKVHVELGLVENYPPATDETAVDPLNTKAYITPATMVSALEHHLKAEGGLLWPSYAISPQTVVAGAVSSRVSGWSVNDMSTPAAYVIKKSSRSVTIRAGLQVTYAERHKCRLSEILDKNIDFLFEETPPNGVHYLYANINNDGVMDSFGSTQHIPKEGFVREATNGDFFDMSQCVMLNSAQEAIRRVYLAKVWFQNADITTILPVPLGVSATLPVLSELPLGASLILNNPFISPVETLAQVEYNSSWSPSEWNDQIGVMAHPRPANPLDQILVQCGLMGYLTGGQSAGNAHGSSFATITIAPRINVVVSKLYK